MDIALLPGYIMQVAPEIPIMAAYAVGIIVAASRLERHRRVSLLAIAGLGLMLAWSILGAVLRIAAQQMMVAGGWGATQLGVAFAVLGLVGSAVTTAGLALVLVALFADRPQAAG